MYCLTVKTKGGKLYIYSDLVDKTVIKTLDDDDVISDRYGEFKWSELKNHKPPDHITGFRLSYNTEFNKLLDSNPKEAENFIKNRSDTEIVSGKHLPQ